MNTFTVDQHRAASLQAAMVALHADPKKTPADFYSATVEPGVAMLVESINADPYVFLPPTTVVEFDSIKGSGTDKLRQRMLAGVFFSQLVDDHKRKVALELSAQVSVVPAATGMRP